MNVTISESGPITGADKRFAYEFKSGFRIIRQNTKVAEEILENLLPDPDQFFEEATILKPGSRTHAGVIMLVGQPYLLKRYNCRGVRYRFLNAFRRSRAVRAWNVAWKFLDRNLPVPTPYAVLEERRFRLLGRSYVLMEYVGKGETLRKAWFHLDQAGRTELLRHLGHVLGTMHRSGCIHGDLKWSNLIVQPETPGVVTLVDLDGSYLMKTIRDSVAVKDLARFVRDFEARCSDDELKELFISSWKKSFGMT